MCGIAGWYRRYGQPVAQAAIGEQCRRLIHRGPDDQGVLVDGDFGFGMRRLSIIDVAGGHQPIDSADGRFAIVFNGEIYNHLDLRAAMGPAARFRTRSDTETIVAGFARWGDELWPRLEGMFAIAIWDRRERRLTLARDHAGQKPLYFTEQSGGLAFASELPALLALPGHDFALDPVSIDQFFSFGHILPGRSIYRAVATLDPGQVLTIGPDGDKQVRRYWTPRFAAAPRLSEGQWIEQLRVRWLATVAAHMLSDVEVGAFLSGGVDSSAVVAAMTRATDRPVRTFTIGFPDQRFNEAPFAERVADHLGTVHTTRIVDVHKAIDVIPAVARCYGEPFADPAAIPTWYLSQLAAQHVKTVLSGDGGDELFFGYRRHLTEQRLGAAPALAKAAARLLLKLPPLPLTRLNHRLQIWQKALRTDALPSGFERYFAKRQLASPALLAKVYTPGFVAAIGGLPSVARLAHDYFPDPALGRLGGLDQFALGEFCVSLPAVMLTKVDRASMAHSLEVRAPMLGPGLIDWALTIPDGMKIRHGVGKYVLRKAVEPWLPPGIVGRAKQGFLLPMADWFANDFGHYAHDVWSDSGAADDGLLDRRAVDGLFDEHRAGRRDHSRFLYSLTVYGLWRSGQAAVGQ